MDVKMMKKILQKVFDENGFKSSGNQFFKEFDEVILIFELNYMPQSQTQVLDFSYKLKCFASFEQLKGKEPFERGLPGVAFNRVTGEIGQNCIEYERLTEEQLRCALNNTIKEYSSQECLNTVKINKGEVLLPEGYAKWRKFVADAQKAELESVPFAEIGLAENDIRIAKFAKNVEIQMAGLGFENENSVFCTETDKAKLYLCMNYFNYTNLENADFPERLSFALIFKDLYRRQKNTDGFHCVFDFYVRESVFESQNSEMDKSEKLSYLIENIAKPIIAKPYEMAQEIFGVEGNKQFHALDISFEAKKFLNLHNDRDLLKYFEKYPDSFPLGDSIWNSEKKYIKPDEIEAYCKEILQEYGFEKKGRFLTYDFGEVTVAATTVAHWLNGLFFEIIYALQINAIHGKNSNNPLEIFENSDIQATSLSTFDKKIIHRIFTHFVTKQELHQSIHSALCKTFDPFKYFPFEHLLANSTPVPLERYFGKFFLKQSAQEFFKLQKYN